MAFSGAFVKPFRPAFDAGAAAASVPWYLAGGAPTPIAVYQPIGAASLAASYVNIVNPGTYDAAPGVAPTLDASGWVLNGLTQYLTTGISPASGYSAMIQFDNASVLKADRCCFGVYKYAAPAGGFCIFTSSASGNDQIYYYGGNELRQSPRTTAAVLAIAGAGVYRDGISEGSLNGTLPAGIGEIYIGALNAGTPAAFWSGKIQTLVIWDRSTNHAVWMPQVMAAAALI